MLKPGNSVQWKGTQRGRGREGEKERETVLVYSQLLCSTVLLMLQISLFNFPANEIFNYRACVGYRAT